MKIKNQIQRVIYILAFVIGVIIFYNACFIQGKFMGIIAVYQMFY